MFNLNLQERIMLDSILPKENTTFEDLIISEGISNKIKVTTDEIEEFGIKTVEGGLQWNEKGKDAEFDYDFSETEKNMIKKELLKMNETKKMNIQLMSLYRTFVNV